MKIAENLLQFGFSLQRRIAQSSWCKFALTKYIQTQRLWPTSKCIALKIVAIVIVVVVAASHAAQNIVACLPRP